MLGVALVLLISILFNPHPWVSSTSVCPKKCVCDHSAAVQSMQCFRVQAIPSQIPRDTKIIKLAYNHIKEVKVSEKYNDA